MNDFLSQSRHLLVLGVTSLHPFISEKLFLTLGAHAQRGLLYLGLCVCLCVPNFGHIFTSRLPTATAILAILQHDMLYGYLICPSLRTAHIMKS